MELVSLARDIAQSAAEQAASYRPGQSVLRQLDRVLWVIEKSARWAVPPPLDQDDSPQPELVRPLPWVFFLMMLVALRVSRESISLLNLALGKPPVTSTDVVIFIQSKRRYLRTLKYQGSRVSRARGAVPWAGSLHRLLETAMCFRRQSAYGNNNTTRLSNNDEMMVVKRSKRGRQETSPVTSAGDNMERLIEKMMADLDAESEDDSSTLTYASPKSEQSELTEDSDHVTTLVNKTPTKLNGNSTLNGEDLHFSPNNNVPSSTPEKAPHNHVDALKSAESPRKEVKRELEENNISGIEHSGRSPVDRFRGNLNCDSPNSSDYTSCDDVQPTPTPKKRATKQISESFIAGEKEKTPNKIGNGRTVKSTPNKKKGPHRDKLSTSEVPPARVLTSNNSF